jgi:hypothetical protein
MNFLLLSGGGLRLMNDWTFSGSMYTEPLILWEKPLILYYLKQKLCPLHILKPTSIHLGKNPAYPPAIQELINEKSLAKETLIRQTKYLNNIVERKIADS